MKQHIDQSQLEELTNEQREKLFKWQGKKHYPLLYFSIGQMIEFLSEQDDVMYHDTHIDGSFRYVLTTGGKGEDLELGWTNYQGKTEELADALWEAVKEVL